VNAEQDQQEQQSSNVAIAMSMRKPNGGKREGVAAKACEFTFDY
jgi:hypothetical protein